MLNIEAGLGKERERGPVGTAEARSRHNTGGNQEAKKVRESSAGAVETESVSISKTEILKVFEA